MSARAPRSANHLGHSPSGLDQGPDEIDMSGLAPSASEIEGLRQYRRPGRASTLRQLDKVTAFVPQPFIPLSQLT